MQDISFCKEWLLEDCLEPKRSSINTALSLSIVGKVMIFAWAYYQKPSYAIGAVGFTSNTFISSKSETGLSTLYREITNSSVTLPLCTFALKKKLRQRRRGICYLGDSLLLSQLKC
jgi:hypothetical protein